MDSDETTKVTPAGMAAIAFGINLVVGAALGMLIGATRTTQGDYFTTAFASMTEQPLKGADKTFNMLILVIFVATGIICATVAWAVGTLTNGSRPRSPRVSAPPLAPPVPGSPEDTAY